MPLSRLSPGVARNRELESITTRRLLADASMKEMVHNTIID
jgi:hypothetical protein